MTPNLSESPQRGGSSRILMYCHDGFGLGHLRRTTTLAQSLQAAQPGCSVLMAVGSAALPFWKDFPGLDYIKLPSIRKVGTGRWRARSLPISPTMVHSMRAAMLRDAVQQFKPHLLVTDYLPLGPAGELLPALEAAHDMGTRCVLGLRDILDSPETVRRLWEKHGTMEAIDEWYDRVLVYGDPIVFDTLKTYSFPKSVAEKTSYCGYVVGSRSHVSPAQVRKRLNLSTPNLVLVTGGGGQDAAPLIQTFLAGLREREQQARLNGHHSFDSVVILGPLMDRDTRNSIRTEAEGLPVRIRTDVSDTGRFIAASDLVVTMGGYNTLMEVAQAGKQAVVVPRHGPSQEQKMRAELFAGKGWVVAAPDVETITGGQLIARIESALKDPLPHPWQGLHQDGTEQAVASLIACLPVSRPEPDLYPQQHQVSGAYVGA